MGKENFIYVSMPNCGDVTAIQTDQVYIGDTKSITYNHDGLIHIRENCKQDMRYKILGYDTCKSIRRLRLNRRIAWGPRLKYNQQRRQQMLNSTETTSQ